MFDRIKKVARFSSNIWSTFSAMDSHYPNGSRNAGADFWYRSEPNQAGSGPIGPSNALQISAVFSCVRILVDAIAPLPLEFKLRDPKDATGRSKLTVVDNVPHRLMRKPNVWLNRFEFKELVVASLALRGNFYARIVPGRSALLPIHPSRILETTQGSDGRVYYEVDYGDGEIERLSQNEIFHVKLFSDDGLTGLSPIAMSQNGLSLAKSLETYSSNFYGRQARPGGIVAAEEGYDKETRRNMRNEIEDATSGENSGRLLVLPAALKWHSMGISQKDAQTLETEKFTDEKIARIFGIPPHKLNLMDHSTFSNIEQQSIDFINDVVFPTASRIETAIEDSIVIEEIDGELEAEFDLKQLMRGDSASRGTYINTLITAQVITVNEGRSMEGLNPIEGGDVPRNPNINTGGLEADSAEELDAQALSHERDRSTRIIFENLATRLHGAEGEIDRRIDHVNDAASLATFDEWLATFYGKHSTMVKNGLAPIFEIHQLDDAEISAVSDRYLASRRDSIVDALREGLVRGGVLTLARSGCRDILNSLDKEFSYVAK